MKKIEKLAREWVEAPENYCDGWTNPAMTAAYQAGFRKARELFAEKYGDQADYLFSEDILKIGEEDV